MGKYDNGLKKIIQKLPNEGQRSGWVKKVQENIKKRNLQEASSSLLYALINDNAPITTTNMYLVEIIIHTINELCEEYKSVKSLIKETA